VRFSIGSWWNGIKGKLKQKSGGKFNLNIKLIGGSIGGFVIGIALLMSFFTPKEDHTFFRRTTSGSVNKNNSVSSNSENKETVPSNSPNPMSELFKQGQKQKLALERKEAEEKRQKVSVKYYAPQVLGTGLKGRKAIMSGAKLIGVLMTSIDTRNQGRVGVRLTQGGEFGGLTIEKDSVLKGRFSYPGSGEKVYLNFNRIDSPDGESKKIAAQALDAGTYTAGILGEEFTGNGVKIASSIGLDMFAGMTDTLTERETLGNTYNGVQARPTMKNALLQGMSRASKEQAGRVASTINSEPGYVIIPEGKEMIIELLEDFTNERPKNQY
jgi:hypothetical protein